MGLWQFQAMQVAGKRTEIPYNSVCLPSLHNPRSLLSGSPRAIQLIPYFEARWSTTELSPLLLLHTILICSLDEIRVVGEQETPASDTQLESSHSVRRNSTTRPETDQVGGLLSKPHHSSSTLSYPLTHRAIIATSSTIMEQGAAAEALIPSFTLDKILNQGPPFLS